MSLWTPDGERPVRRETPVAPDDTTPSPAELLALVAAANGIAVEAMPADQRRELESQLESMSAEERATLVSELGQMVEMERVRAELARLPATTHVSRFLQQFVESFLDLTSAYLQADPPKFNDAATMIASVETLLDAFDDQIGEMRGPVDQALSQLKTAFVALKQQSEDLSPEDQGAGGQDAGGDPENADDAPEGADPTDATD